MSILFFGGINVITKLHFDDFRIFKDKDIYLGEVITAIAGQNASGKSTILSVLCNSCELKSGDGKTITNKAFKSEFSEIIKGSKTHDKPNGFIGHITINNQLFHDYNIRFRVTWQKKKTDDVEATRFRIIPSRQDPHTNKNLSSKFPMPVFYLGLSRLYPLGETADEKIQNFTLAKLNDNDIEWLNSNYKKILSLYDINIHQITNYKIDNKVSGGINTDEYDYLTNSCGQDNLMQILYVLLSFKKLFEDFKVNNKIWLGGIFAIDEIDASLHPAAQIKLLDLMYNLCKEINIQVVFTTHSLQLLNALSKYKNKKEVSISYLTTANNTLQIKNNPEYCVMESDMMITNFYTEKYLNQITVYSEDDEARWFFSQLLDKHLPRLNIVHIKLGAQSLLDLLYHDNSYFKNVLFILDGDQNETKSKKYESLSSKFNNIITLPGNISPEQLIFDYLINLPAEHEILEDNLYKGVTIRSIREQGPFTNKYMDCKKDREKYKQWFVDNKTMLEDIDVVKFWIRDNPELYNSFMNDFVKSFNILANRIHIPRIIK